MSLVTISVDGKHMNVEDGMLLIDALIKNNIDLPYFCYHEAIGAEGNCRMCMVEIEGQKRPQIACDTFVKEGMEIRIDSPKVNKVRQDILELELINHPVDCPTCDQAGECSLQDYYMDYGLYDHHIEKKEKNLKSKKVDLGRNVMLDQERCVLCTRCVRFTQKITKTFELGVAHRGDHSYITTMPGRGLESEYAMNVVDICPVGALTSKDFRFNQRVWFLKPVESICHGCTRGCNIYVDHNKEKYKDDIIFRIRPRINEDINGHFICDHGRLSYKEIHENRFNEPYHKVQIKEMFDSIMSSRGKTAVLVDASLYLEEMATILQFSQSIGADILCPSEVYLDESFEDDMLRTKYKCANINGIKSFEIQTEVSDKEYDLVINFNHPDFVNFKAKQSISFQTHNNFKADLMIPVAAYAETSGTLLNLDNVKQYCNKVIEPNDPVLTINEWMEYLR